MNDDKTLSEFVCLDNTKFYLVITDTHTGGELEGEFYQSEDDVGNNREKLTEGEKKEAAKINDAAILDVDARPVRLNEIVRNAN